MAEEKDEIKIEKGIIGFFDILGYQTFLNNNTPEEAANEVLAILTSIDSKIIDSFVYGSNLDFKTKDEESDRDFLLNKFNWLVFSDTILLTCNYSKQIESETTLSNWFYFCLIASHLCTKMLEFGLPVRGAISFGEFVTRKNCFAGKPIVEAYKTSQRLNLASCILTESAKEEFENLTSLNVNLSKWMETYLIYKYLIPFKDGESEEYILDLEINSKKYKKDIRQAVLDGFWKHKKDIPISAHEKIDNTEKFIRFLEYKKNIKKKE